MSGEAAEEQGAPRPLQQMQQDASGGEGPSRATGFAGGQLAQDKLGLASTFHDPAPCQKPVSHDLAQGLARL